MSASARDRRSPRVPSHDLMRRALDLAQGFINNNRGIDEDKDLPSEMLAAIYKNIKSREIKNDMIMCESENATFNGARIAGWLDKVRRARREGSSPRLRFSDACP